MSVRLPIVYLQSGMQLEDMVIRVDRVLKWQAINGHGINAFILR